MKSLGVETSCTKNRLNGACAKSIKATFDNFSVQVTPVHQRSSDGFFLGSVYFWTQYPRSAEVNNCVNGKPRTIAWIFFSLCIS